MFRGQFEWNMSVPAAVIRTKTNHKCSSTNGFLADGSEKAPVQIVSDEHISMVASAEPSRLEGCKISGFENQKKRADRAEKLCPK